MNYEVAKLLRSLLIEFTKSRANRTQDNALVEGKNGAIIRKHIGYGHIGAEYAERVQKFYTAHLNPYLNLHRPCGFATVSLDARREEPGVERFELEGLVLAGADALEAPMSLGHVFDQQRLGWSLRLMLLEQDELDCICRGEMHP